MLMTDIFADDAFQFANMTAAIQKLPYTENRLGELGLFGPGEGIQTGTVTLDVTDKQIKVLTSRPRGAPPERAAKDPKAKMFALVVPHFQFEDHIEAASLLGKRQPGTSDLVSVATVINDSYQNMLNLQLAPTFEMLRLGALQGVLRDGDGDVIYDYFDFFDATAVSVAFTFSSATFNVRAKCIEVKRAIRDQLGNVPFSGIHALCGSEFFDKLVSHPSVVQTYLNWQAAQELRSDYTETGFTFGGITFEEYRGVVGLPDDIGEIPADEAVFFPLGVPGMYRSYYAPATFLETVGTVGQSMYAKVAPDLKYNAFVDTLMETNPLFVNTRPDAVIRGTMN